MRDVTLIDHFATALRPAELEILEDLSGYVEWRTQRLDTPFVPHRADDVEIRSYLLHQKLGGADRRRLARTVASLKRFYEWARNEGRIDESPFEQFDFDRPLLGREQVRRRRLASSENPAEREIARLRALNRIAEHLNRSADLRTLMETVLQELVAVMGLDTAWAFFRTQTGLHTAIAASDPPHDFALVACCGLPSDLEGEDRRYLRRPPDCMCQALLRNGRLVRAVNVVECTRLRDAVRAGGDARGLLFHASVPLRSRGETLGLVNAATESWEFLTPEDLELLSAVGAQLTVALERARLFDLAESRRVQLERELETARAVQRSFLPSTLPSIEGYAFAAEWSAARQVAGDFDDVFPLEEGLWGIVLADVSGKGAPAALYMAMARSLIRTAARQTPSPAAVLSEVNRRLLADSASSMFVTVWYGVLDVRTGSLAYALAGHPPPLLRRASGATGQFSFGQIPLGMFDSGEWADREVELEPGDALIAYTDGVTESVNERDEDYGVDRLLAAVVSASDSAADLVGHVCSDLVAFRGSAAQADDITLLALVRRG